MKIAGKKAKYALFFLIQAALMFLLAEGICRVFHLPYRQGRTTQETSFGKFDPMLGWSYKPADFLVQTRGKNPKKFLVDFNRDGIRMPGPGHVFDPARPSVIFSGCSFVFGHDLPYEDTLPGRFEAMDPARRQAVNLGVQGYGTDQSLLFLQKVIPQFKTDAVVYEFISEHIKRNNNYDRRRLHPKNTVPGTKPFFEVLPDGHLRLAKKPVEISRYGYSRFIELAILSLGKLVERFRPVKLDLTRALILEMKKTAESRHARFYIVNWDVEAGPIRAMLDSVGAPVLHLPDHRPPFWETEYLRPDRHPDTKANTLVASLLIQMMDASGKGKP